MKTDNLGNILYPLNFKKLAKPAALFTIAIFAMSMFAIFSSTGVKATAPLTVLHVSGNKIYNANDQQVILKGMVYTYFVDATNKTSGSWELPSGAIVNAWNTADV